MKKILATFFLCLSLIGLFNIIIHSNNKQLPSETTIPKSEVKVVHSETECKVFFESKLQELFVNMSRGKTQYSEINTRFTSANIKHISLKVCVNYHWLSKDVEGSAGEAPDGEAEIQIYVPSIMDTFEGLERTNIPHWHEGFESHMIVMFMHEMEHARYRTTETTHVDIKEESRAWAETCKYIIAPLALRKIPLLGGDAALYVAWRDSAGNTSDPRWVAAIEHLYGKYDGKKDPNTTRK